MTTTDTIKALRDALTECRNYLSDFYANAKVRGAEAAHKNAFKMQQVADDALALTADASEDAPMGYKSPAEQRCYSRGYISGRKKGYEEGVALAARPAPVGAGMAVDVAPWPDFLGRPIHHGARLLHPQDGDEFVAVRLPESADDPWRAIYSDGTVSRLCLQIGDKGQAVLVAAPAAPAENDDDLFYPTKAALKREDWDAATRKPKVIPAAPDSSAPLCPTRKVESVDNKEK